MAKIISFDIWDTIIKRKCHPEEIKLATARYIVLKYENEAWNFLQSLIGLDLSSIEKIALRVHFMDLVEKIASLRQNLICYRSNEERAYQIYQNDEFVKLLDCQIHRHFKESLEFEPLFKEGFMGLKVDAQFLGEDVNIILAGSVYTDYKKILQYIKEAALANKSKKLKMKTQKILNICKMRICKISKMLSKTNCKKTMMN